MAAHGQRVVGVFPTVLVRSRLAGRMLVSVPYGVGGGILADDDRIAERLFEHAKEIALEERCRHIDLRSEQALLPNLPVNHSYVGFQRTLPERMEDVLRWLPRKARAAARNGREKYGLKVAFGDEHLRTVWKLYTRTMRRVASIAYPFSFFRALIARTPNRHWVSIVCREGQPIAGLVTFLFGDRVMPYFYGALDRAREYDAGNFVYLTVMERAVAAGYRVFDFGRSRRENRGSFDFKRFCGFEPRPLRYQYYTLPGCSPPKLSPSDGRYRWARRLWPHLPLGLTRVLGGRLARHVPG
jgi:FemAB-related protein (PEP-CTERM system-associated)